MSNLHLISDSTVVRPVDLRHPGHWAVWGTWLAIQTAGQELRRDQRDGWGQERDWTPQDRREDTDIWSINVRSFSPNVHKKSNAGGQCNHFWKILMPNVVFFFYQCYYHIITYYHLDILLHIFLLLFPNSWLEISWKRWTEQWKLFSSVTPCLLSRQHLH